MLLENSIGVNEPAMPSQRAEPMLNAFSKAYESAVSNYDAAAALIDLGCHALAASIAIAGLEEVGKMILLDDFLFSRTGSQRFQWHYRNGQLAHPVKLDALEFYPDFLNCLTLDVPQRDEKGYKQLMAIARIRYDTKRQKLAELFGQEFTFDHLEVVKQQGLYSHETGGIVRVNRDAVDLEVARAILELVQCISDTLRLVLGSSLEHYRDLFHAHHKAGREANLGTIRDDAAEIFRGMFGFEDER